MNARDYGSFKSSQRPLKYIPFSLHDIKVTEKSMDTGDEAPEVSTLFNTYIPLGDPVSVRLSNKCLFFLFLLSLLAPSAFTATSSKSLSPPKAITDINVKK